MKLLITGGAGFVGARLARTLLARGTLDGKAITQVVIADQAAAPADLLADARVQGRVGKLLGHCQGLRDEAFDGVFHLASAVSGECEADFELGLHSNLDSTRALLDALRHRQEQGATPTKLVFSSSVAVFGPDPALPFAGDRPFRAVGGAAGTPPTTAQDPDGGGRRPAGGVRPSSRCVAAR